MIRIVGGLLALLALTPALTANDKSDKPTTPAEQYKAIVAEYTKALADWRKALADAGKAFREAKPEDRKKIVRPNPPKPEVYAGRLMELAVKHPKDPIASEALAWAAHHDTANAGDPESVHAKALAALTRDYLHSDGTDFRKLIESLQYYLDEASAKFLHAVLKKSPHREIRGKASLSLAQRAAYRLQRAQDFKEMRGYQKRLEPIYGKKVVEELAKADHDKLRQEAIARYERVLKDFGDLSAGSSGTIKQLAEAELDKLRHPIAVGKPVPDIEGEDIDGHKFKLSDYRGKVVLLDFWGNW